MDEDGHKAKNKNKNNNNNTTNTNLEGNHFDLINLYF